ncbi:fungal-specific transcription factor domain-containing protein [Armillaria mellea]|nr:fungal-specific transcription factor domain-containing protein [Armillaria mellea]
METGKNAAANGKKKLVVQRACDVCRRRKIRCDGIRTSGKRCSTCIAGRLDCTYIESIKGAPSKRYVRSLEDRVEKMESLLRKVCAELIPCGGRDINRRSQILPPEADLKEELEAVQMLPEDATSMLPALVHSLGFEEPEVEDRDPALEKNLEEFEEYIVGYRYHGKSSSLQFVQEAMDVKAWQPGTLFNITSFPSFRPEFWEFRPWNNPHRYVPQGMNFKFPPGDLMPTLIDAYFMYMNNFLPLLHRPTFEKSLREGLHYRNFQFGGVLLVVCALGSRFVDDPRVLMEGEQSKASSGWKWIYQVTSRRRSFPSLDPPNLYDAQLCCLLSEFYLGSSAPQQSWTLAGVGLRIAQDAGAHRKKTTRNSSVTNTVEAELWKRVFWCLVGIDRALGSALGRACAIYDEDIDIDLPTECDDEYWEHPDPQQAFKQPPGKPSTVSFCNCYLRLTRLIMVCMRTIYSIHKSKVLFVLKKNWEHQVVVELDSALNKWVDSIPEHLRWDPDRADLVHFHQSATLLLLYYHLQMLIHRPFITAPRTDVGFPSLVICTNAARSCSHIAELQNWRNGSYFPPVSGLLSFNAGIVLLVNVWSGRHSGLAIDVDKEMEDVHKCMRVLAELEMRYQYAGILWDILYELATASDLPLPDSVETEPSESFEYAKDSDWMPYANPQQQLYTLPISTIDLGRKPLDTHIAHISDWYNANPYDCTPATASELDNVMAAIWDRAPNGLEPDDWRGYVEYAQSQAASTRREF